MFLQVMLSGLLALSVHQPGRQQDDIRVARSKLRQAAAAALHTERLRSMVTFCQDPHYSQADLNECAARELTITLHNYEVYRAALANLLRLEFAEDGAGSADAAREALDNFNKAEVSWNEYSEQSCHAVSSQNAGGSMRPLTDLFCRIGLTKSHINELADSFSFLQETSDR